MHFSYFQKMNELRLSICEECGGEIERVITGGTGLIFKGSGFYLTDYKNGKKKPEENKKDQNITEKSEKNNNSKSTKAANQSNTKKKEISDE